MTTFTAAERKTATGTKVYLHWNCTCHRIGGRTLKDITSPADAMAYATERGYTTGYCKTSPEAPDAAPALDQPQTPATDTTEEEPAPVPEGSPVESSSEWTVEVNNLDQAGKQRRDGITAIVSALGGGQITYTSIKTKSKRGNAAFVVTVTGNPAAEQPVRAWLTAMEAELPTTVERAKAEAKAMEGASSNDRMKAWKGAVRRWIAQSGADFAAELRA
ncbi:MULTISPECIES: hypothetical protein [Streptomycetaceae]|uniref:Uncharacterized protein n=1 Tax=Streptantibioticus cattleyicolor (strain ATCC 35852 / DSM 46488 / JCM 4925 / NBRC 14057 / NRRL 8057) TaxID=1003195 RepID=F8JT47_STREN|nr:MULTISPECIES: hypothetical protein [Streptomycetaceae]AEW92986.1 hypothetical protein SCATT_06150 [Streptantibioticus cattleyicolor NRRL 8057 = DSM 46488]MYS57726.1 hypothetical protein [Streptomyces sp. SID5468]CCB73345.1 protein of unknown function [Streptantibioticus cattleyicolor NRRL 8057 = DSM 46488]